MLFRARAWTMALALSSSCLVKIMSLLPLVLVVGCLSQACVLLLPTWYVFAVGVGAVVSVVALDCRSLAGSPLCVVQVCHGMPHRHCQCRTNCCRRHALHQVRWLSLSMSNLSLVPSTACLQVGQCMRMMSGNLTVVVVVVFVVKLLAASSLLVVVACCVCGVSTCTVPGWKGHCGHLCRLSSHFVLPFVLSL